MLAPRSSSAVHASAWPALAACASGSTPYASTIFQPGSGVFSAGSASSAAASFGSAPSSPAFLAATEQFRDGPCDAPSGRGGTVDRIGELWIEAAILEAETRRTEIIRHLPARHVRHADRDIDAVAAGAIAGAVKSSAGCRRC